MTLTASRIAPPSAGRAIGSLRSMTGTDTFEALAQDHRTCWRSSTASQKPTALSSPPKSLSLISCPKRPTNPARGCGYRFALDPCYPSPWRTDSAPDRSRIWWEGRREWPELCEA
jgi:hypothetical protein